MKKNLLKISFWIVWFAVAYYGTSLTLTLLARLMFGHNRLLELANDAVFGAVFSMIIFAVMLILIWLVPNKFFRKKISLKTAGLYDYPTWSDLMLGLAGFLVAMFLSVILTNLLQPLLGFDANQKQNIGFMNISQSYEYILAFISLVVLAPIAEELIFRGVIYGELRQINPFMAAVIVSLMFAVAHGQMNVAVTTFAMSLVMCFMRERITGTIWSSIFLHIIKNGLAFYLIFINPILSNLN